jgi:anti-anti-sigma factor
MDVLGKIDDEKAAWGRLRDHPDRRPVAGVVVVRLDAPLFWANASAFEDRLLAEVDEWPDTRALVLDLEATTQLDTTSADVLTHLAAELDDRNVSLYLARVLHGVKTVLQRSGFGELVGPDRFWHSISQCVRAARRDTGLKGNGAASHAATYEGSAEVEDVIAWDDDATMIDDEQADPSTS